MTEMANAGEDDRHSRGFCGLQAFRVADRTTGMDHGRDPCLRSDLNRIGKGEERIGSQHGAAHLLPAALDGNPHAIHPVRLSAANAHGRLSPRQDNRVRFDMLAGFPGET